MFFALLVAIAVEYGGLTNHIPLLKTIRLTTVLSYTLVILSFTQIGVGDLFRRPQVRIIVALAVLTALSVLWAVVRTHAFVAIRPMIDYLVFLIIVATLADRSSRIDAISWLLAGICVFLVATNFGKLTSAVRSGPFEAGYFMGDGNDFAWGLVVCLPLILNLVLGPRPLLARAVGTLGVIYCLIGIVGSSSRGASLGLAASLGFYWLVLSKRKALGAVAIAGVAAGILVFAPATYFQRMQSVAEYQEDNSARARLQAWTAAVRMAVDYPLGVGAGNFSSAYGRLYMPPIEKNAIGWAPGRWLSAHSIYFRVLGEYGIIGLSLLVSIIVLNIRDNLRSQRILATAGTTAQISSTWPALLNMSMVGFAVCGVFLGGLTYPHLFMLTALTISADRLARASPEQAPTLIRQDRRRRRLKP